MRGVGVNGENLFRRSKRMLRVRMERSYGAISVDAVGHINDVDWLTQHPDRCGDCFFGVGHPALERLATAFFPIQLSTRLALLLCRLPLFRGVAPLTEQLRLLARCLVCQFENFRCRKRFSANL